MLSPIVVKIFEVMPESFVVALGKKIMNGYIKKYADLNIEGYEKIKDTAVELEKHYWFNKNKYVRLFDKDDLEKYLDVFDVLNIEEKETVRFNHKKNYLVFFVKKN